MMRTKPRLAAQSTCHMLWRLECQVWMSDLPGSNRRLDHWPADCAYLMCFMLLVVLFDLLVSQAHLLDGLPVEPGMVCRR